jgi:hypothetical protein
MRIYRYELTCAPEQTIQIPQDCAILSVDSRDSFIAVRVAVDPESPLVEHTFRVVTDGVAMPDYFKCLFIDTVVMRYGADEIAYHVSVKAKEVKC